MRLKTITITALMWLLNHASRKRYQFYVMFIKRIMEMQQKISGVKRTEWRRGLNKLLWIKLFELNQNSHFSLFSPKLNLPFSASPLSEPALIRLTLLTTSWTQTTYHWYFSNQRNGIFLPTFTISLKKPTLKIFSTHPGTFINVHPLVRKSP